MSWSSFYLWKELKIMFKKLFKNFFIFLNTFFICFIFTFNTLASEVKIVEIEGEIISPTVPDETVPIIEVEELPPILDGFVYIPEIPLDEEQQHLLWNECVDRGVEYTFALAVIQKESEFNPKATNHNKNGSTDKGLFQTNSCWWKTLIQEGMITYSDDLYDPATGIKCGVWELSKYVGKYGNTERAYAAYNTGRDVKSNKNSRKVMQYWEAWKEVIR